MTSGNISDRVRHCDDDKSECKSSCQIPRRRELTRHLRADHDRCTAAEQNQYKRSDKLRYAFLEC